MTFTSNLLIIMMNFASKKLGKDLDQELFVFSTVIVRSSSSCYS